MAGDVSREMAGPEGLARRLVTWWALAGGVVLMAVVALQTASVIGGVFGHPLPGDFELTELGIAVAVFAFLPYCQLKDANVTADIFTSGLGSRAKAALGFVASVVALVFAVIMIWRTSAGTVSQFEYDYQTAILGIPVGYAYGAIVVSLVLLALACLVTLAEGARGMSARPEDRKN